MTEADEVAAEQATIDDAYRRLTAMRARAERVAALARRVASMAEMARPVCFGRPIQHLSIVHTQPLPPELYG